MTRHDKFYRRLLALYPKTYRQNYADQIAQTFDDMLSGEKSRGKRILLTVREYMTLPGNIIEQYAAEIAKRGGLSPQSLLAIVSIVLLLPLITAFAADELTEHFSGSHPFANWLWTPAIIFVWLVILPGISLAITLSAYLIIVFRRSIHRSRISLQLKESWVLIAAAAVVLGLLAVVFSRHGTACLQPQSNTNPGRIFQCIVTGITIGDQK